MFREDVDIVPTIVDDKLSYVPWGGDNQMPFDLLALVEKDETLATCQCFNAVNSSAVFKVVFHVPQGWHELGDSSTFGRFQRKKQLRYVYELITSCMNRKLVNFLPDRVCITDIVSIFKVIETVVPYNQESEYQEILRQAVAVIEEARSKAAHAIVSTSNEMHWNIGKLLFEKKLESKHGDQVV